VTIKQYLYMFFSDSLRHEHLIAFESTCLSVDWLTPEETFASHSCILLNILHVHINYSSILTFVVHLLPVTVCAECLRKTVNHVSTRPMIQHGPCGAYFCWCTHQHVKYTASFKESRLQIF